MRATLTAGVAILAIAAGVPASATGPGTAARVTPVVAVITGEAYYPHVGQGSGHATFAGTVTASTGDFPLDAVVTIDADYEMPTDTCPLTETLSGVLSVEGVPYGVISWSRVGSTLTVTTSTGASGTGTSVFVQPSLINPCGPAPGTAAVTISLGAPGSTDPDDTTFPSDVCVVPATPAGGQAGDAVCGGVSGVAINRRSGAILTGHGELAALSGSAHTVTVTEIAYENREGQGKRKGRSIAFTVTNPDGCHRGGSFSINLNGDYKWWNDRISSAWTYGGCVGDHYEHWDLTGSMRRCTCPTMSVMDNHTTSIWWHR